MEDACSKLDEENATGNLVTIAVDLGERVAAFVTVARDARVVDAWPICRDCGNRQWTEQLIRDFRERGPRQGSFEDYVVQESRQVARVVSREIVKIADANHRAGFRVVVIFEKLHSMSRKKTLKKRIPDKEIMVSAKSAPSSKVKMRAKNRAQKWMLKHLVEETKKACRVIGVQVAEVPHDSTSVTCHRCGARGRRTKRFFYCADPYCRLVSDCDFNASVNLHRVFLEAYMT